MAISNEYTENYRIPVLAVVIKPKLFSVIFGQRKNKTFNLSVNYTFLLSAWNISNNEFYRLKDWNIRYAYLGAYRDMTLIVIWLRLY